jgi:hypothetical protein
VIGDLSQICLAMSLHDGFSCAVAASVVDWIGVWLF